MKASKSNPCSDFESEPDKGNEKGKNIIDAVLSANVSTKNIQKEELEDPKEGDHLFHS